ncbi:dimethylamine monooxygenase subunit DmmA family protein [Mycolicibacterium sp.]|uniref:dimethylamine monooxygenase subunit DmmA family protein n=1 Tax=Mycolicibacterium sp. TaxID=2320850 RepID=UPI003D11BC8A
MDPALELTSVPPWATTPTRPGADLSGRFWSIVAFGTAGADVAEFWCGQIAAVADESAVRVHEFGADDSASDALAADVVDARVGWRLMMAGPAYACLRLRAAALALGVADDEITVASTEVRTRSVQCAHCRAVTCRPTQLEDVVACAGCGRNLFVYYHVSRRQGAHLGFMVDAEQQAAS